MDLQHVKSCPPVNVATNSSNGHFVHKARKVVAVDHLEETYNVALEEGQIAELRTENHGTIFIKKDATIFHQDAYDPISKKISARVD